MKNLLLQVTRTLALLAFVSGLGNGYAQESQELLTASGLKFSFTNESCTNQGGNLPFDFALLKVENLTSTTLNIGFNIEVQYQEGCSGCNGSDESRVNLSLSPNEVIQADCSTTDRTLIFIRNPNFSGSWNFQEIRITNLEIQ